MEFVRDMRDPQRMGEIMLAARREVDPQRMLPMSKLYDQHIAYLDFPNYGESEEQFKQRLVETCARPVGS